MLVGEGVKAQTVELSSIAGVLDPTKGQFRHGHPAAVDEGHPGLDPTGQLIGVLDVLREDGSAQAVAGVVGQFDGLIFGIDLVDGRHRSEHLLVVCRIVLGDVRKDGRHQESPGGIDRFVSVRDLGAGCDGLIQLLLEAIASMGRAHGGHGGLRVAWITHHQFGEGLHHHGDKIVVLVGQDDEALGGAAYLACIHQSGTRRHLPEEVPIGIVQNDEGVIAAQLHGGLLQVHPGRLGHGGPAALRTSQCHTCHPLVRDGLVDLIVVDEEVGQAALGCTGAQNSVLEGHCRGGYIGGVLEDHRVAQDEVGGKDPHDLVVGEVPRLDHDQYAGGLFDVIGLACGVVQRSRFEQVFGLVGEVLGDVCTELNLCPSFGNQLPHVLGQICGKGILFLTEDIRYPAELPGTF